MSTKFGKFISGKFFSKLFWVLFILFTYFCAYETGSALSVLVGKNLYGAVYAAFALIAVSVMTRTTASTKWNNRFYKKARV